MTQAPKLSVLVPIYNVERYLRQCIDSLTAQTLRDIEILLLNDGSTDSCPAICDEYAAKDERIRVIHKPNSGYGATMNIGLKEARGEYIGIVESDDWVESDMFEALYQLAIEQDVDVVKSDFFRYTEEKGDKKANILPPRDLEQVIDPKERSNIFYCQPSIWSAIYRCDFLKRFHIDFLETPGASYQDLGFNFKVWTMASRVWLTTRAFLHYRCDNAQASVKSGGKVFCVVDEWKEIEHFMDQFPEEKKASAPLRNLMKFWNYMWNMKRLSGKEREDFKKVFIQEFREAYEKGELSKSHLSTKNWLDFLCFIYPSSLYYLLLRKSYKIFKIFVKDSVREDLKYWRILFGIIKFKTPANVPSFWK